MIRITRATTFVALVAGLGALGYSVEVRAQEDPTNPPTGTNPTMQPQHAEGAKASLTKQDSGFLRDAAEGGMFEVQLAQVVQEKATNPQVKELAQRIAEDHTKANDQLTSIAQQIGAEVPQTVSKADQKRIDSFGKMDPSKLDSEYVKLMIDDHQKDIKAFTNEVNKGKNESLTSFASQTLPTLKTHLQMAQDAQKSLKPAARM